MRARLSVQNSSVASCVPREGGNFGSDFLYVYGYLFDFCAFSLSSGHGIRFGPVERVASISINSVCVLAFSNALKGFEKLIFRGAGLYLFLSD